MRISRIGIIVAIAISMWIGYKLPPGIIARGTAIFFGICAAAFLPTYIAALYWKRVTKTAAISSILSGVVVSLFTLLFMHKQEAVPLGICKALFGKDFLFDQFPWMIIDPIVIALPLSALVLVVVSYFTKPVDKEHTEMCLKGI